jgi:FMN reductase
VEREEMKIVGLSGGLATPSRTQGLVEFVVNQAVTAFPGSIDLIGVRDLAPELACTFTREAATPKLEVVLEKIERADFLVVGTPIAHGSYTGLLKQLLDLVNTSTAEDKVAIIVGTDRGDCNSLALGHSLRPLLSLLGYRTVPTAVYARDDDFVDLWVAEEAVILRARRAVREAFRVLGFDPPLAALIIDGNALRTSHRADSPRRVLHANRPEFANS